MATEDHDIDEVRHTTWFHEGKLHRFELPKPDQTDVPVGRIPLGPVISEIAKQASALLSGPDSTSVAEILRASYTPEATYGTAFAQLFARIFAEEGLILLDPLDDRLHRVAAPILRQALEQRDDLNHSCCAVEKN